MSILVHFDTPQASYVAREVLENGAELLNVNGVKIDGDLNLHVRPTKTNLGSLPLRERVGIVWRVLLGRNVIHEGSAANIVGNYVQGNLTMHRHENDSDVVL